MNWDKSLSDLEFISKARSQGQKIVFTNGCFDILHVGHIRYLQEARALGDLLVVGVNSDSSVKRLKGETRPFVPEDERREMLLALRSVDACLIFEEDTPEQLIERVFPHILVKGGDWSPAQIVGSQFVLRNGGDVRALSYIPNHSTSEIAARIEQRLKTEQKARSGREQI